MWVCAFAAAPSDCDSVPGADVPYWVAEGTGRAVTVTVTPGAMADMDTHVGRCKLYKDAAAVWGAVKEVQPPFCPLLVA